jgi:hypothetical protein
MAGTSGAETRFALLPGHDDGALVVTRAKNRAGGKFFIIFVDRIFTTLIARLFTKVFDVTARRQAIPCVYRACNAD